MSVTQVQTSGITDDAVTNSKIGAGAVGTTEIAAGAVTTAKINFETALVPVGGIIMWSGSVASVPTGWSICNGANGTPNLQDRFIVGAGSGYGVGATGGDATVTLNINQIPSHNHSIEDSGNHYHGAQTQAGFDVSGNGDAARFDVNDGPPFEGITWDLAGGNHNHGGGTGYQGGGQAHENRPPYYALAFIMRVS